MQKDDAFRKRILKTAEKDTRIRAIILNGSRANPKIKKDKLQDFDIVFVVRDLASFAADPEWIDRFGERIMLQMPESMRHPIGDGSLVYLILLKEHLRLDLTLIELEKQDASLAKDSLSILWLDKEGCLDPFGPASDQDYWVARPDRLEFSSCCNNFWWCCQNVAKGIWREQWPYALGMLNDVIRPELRDMLDWSIGLEHDFKVSTGKWGSDYRDLLSPDDYKLYCQTYALAEATSIWNALHAAIGLFRSKGEAVAQGLGHAYPRKDDQNMSAYLQWVKHEA